MLALLDGDIFAYRCAASAENDSAEVAIWRVRDNIEQCLEAVKADKFQLWLSDRSENNFRYQIYPEYKANRTKPPPRYLPDVLEYLHSDWQANIAIGQEADDALGIEQCKVFAGDIDDPVEYTSIICSIDKDLLQIPGRHFNFVKGIFQEVNPLEGIRHFYKQMLIGDTSDNVFGVYGIGPTKASKALNHIESQDEMYDVVLQLYDGDKGRVLMNGQVLWIRQQEQQIWNPPNVEAIQD
jgi:hypothetical protein